MAQLEREMIIERVRAGMANAKAKGKKIGRTKMRNSVLIRSLLEAKISYREIARIAKCSHGSVHAEKIQMQKELEAAQKKKLEELKTDIGNTVNDKAVNSLKEMNLPIETIQAVEIKLQEEAKSKLEAIQGPYYETYD